jgi:hypothetical protein
MLPALDFEGISLQKLTQARKSLWKQFEGEPNQTHLAAELKVIDDQIALFNLQRNCDANKIEELKLAAVPKLDSLFMLLAVSHRKGS